MNESIENKSRKTQLERINELKDKLLRLIKKNMMEEAIKVQQQINKLVGIGSI